MPSAAWERRNNSSSSADWKITSSRTQHVLSMPEGLKSSFQPQPMQLSPSCSPPLTLILSAGLVSCWILVRDGYSDLSPAGKWDKVSVLSLLEICASFPGSSAPHLCVLLEVASSWWPFLAHKNGSSGTGRINRSQQNNVFCLLIDVVWGTRLHLLRCNP